MRPVDNPLLYANKSVSGDYYATMPPGELDVGRLVQGLPAWRQPKQLTDRVKKTLILADPTEIEWNNDPFVHRTLHKYLASLLAAGFVIYTWHDGFFLPFGSIENDNWFNSQVSFDEADSPFRDSYIPVDEPDEHKIASLAGQSLGVARSDLFILDTEFLQAALGLSHGKRYYLHSRLSSAEIKHHFKQFGSDSIKVISLTSNSLDEYQFPHLDEVKINLAKKPNFPQDPDHDLYKARVLTLTIGVENTLSTAVCNTFKKLHHFHHVEELNVSVNIRNCSVDDISKECKKFRTLFNDYFHGDRVKKLTFKSFNPRDFADQWFSLNTQFPELEELIFYDDQIYLGDDEAIVPFICPLPKLKRLLTMDSEVGGRYSLNMYSNCETSYAALKKVFASLEALEVPILEFGDAPDISKEEVLFPKLRVLRTSFFINEVQDWIHHAPNLEYLDLSLIDDPEETMDDESKVDQTLSLHLPTVRHLILREHVDILFSDNENKDRFKNLIRNAKKLEILDLHEFEYLAFDTETLLMLKRLTLVIVPQDYQGVFLDNFIVSTINPPQHALEISSHDEATVPAEHSVIKKELQAQIDTDTFDDTPDVTIKCPQIFSFKNKDNKYSVQDYRLDVHDLIDSEKGLFGMDLEHLDEEPLYEFPLIPELSAGSADETMWDKYERLVDTDEVQFGYGKTRILLDNQWTPIPSVSTKDELLDLFCTLDGVSLPLMYKYSKRYSLFFIRPREALERRMVFDIEFLLRLPIKRPVMEEHILPDNLRKLVAYYRSFSDGKLPGAPSAADNVVKIHSIITGKEGACRHRSWGLVYHLAHMRDFALLNAELGIDASYDCKYSVRNPFNTAHAFVEVEIDGLWIPVDLGGYPTKVEIIELTPSQTGKKKGRGHDFDLVTPIKESSLGMVKEYGQRYFETWKHNKQLSTMETLLSELMSCNPTSTLIRFAADTEVLHFAEYVLICARQLKVPLFYVHSPNELVIPSSGIVSDLHHIGTISKGYNGPLYDFIQAQATNPHAILLVNYANFTAQDMVRFNTLTDLHPSIQGMNLPGSIKVVGLINAMKKGVYQGADFYSRFKNHETHDPNDPIPDLPVFGKPLAAVSADEYIYIYDPEYWQQELEGQWQLHGNLLVWKEGQLSAFKARGVTTIGLFNAPWSDLYFREYVRQLETVASICMYEADQTILSEREKVCVYKTVNPPQNVVVVNQTTFYRCLTQYHLDEATGQIFTLPGDLAAAENVFITSTLSDNNWNKLLDILEHYEAEGREVTVYASPEVDLPCRCQGYILDKLSLHEVSDTTQVVFSDDIDLSLVGIEDDWNTLVIDVSECDGSDLLPTIVSQAEQCPAVWLFSKKEGFLLPALNDGIRVVLKGRFSPALRDSLAELLLQRVQDPSAPGRLILFPENKEGFGFFPFLYNDACLEEKRVRYYLPTEDKARSYTHILAMRVAGEATWKGIDRLDVVTDLNDLPFDIKTAANEFERGRTELINSALSHSPFVYIAGLTGVGKTSFIEDYAVNNARKLCFGIDAILDWLTSSIKTNPLLFLDEANLSRTDWSCFEGLFHQQKCVFYKGKYYPVSDTHRVVFAGNPANYGDERKTPRLFERHGRAVVFEPLSLAYIYDRILMPELRSVPLPLADAIARQILEVYKLVSSKNRTQVLMTPRELITMVLYIKCFSEHFPDINPVALARYVSHDIGRTLVPSEDREGLPYIPCPILDEQLPRSDAFLVTESRLDAWRRINHLLLLRAYLRKYKDNSYTGIRSIILEGEPGCGKSEMIIAAMEAAGMRQLDFEADNDGVDGYYVIPAAMDDKKKTELRLKALDEGVIVVQEEMNSCLLNEELNNCTLMGKNLAKKPAKTAGFILFGTQNPICMDGRNAMSNALLRRVTVVQTPAYSREELITILTAKSRLEAEDREALVDAYLAKVHEAKLNNHSPAPCFRDLVRSAEGLFRALYSKRKREEGTNESPAKRARALGFFNEGDVIDLAFDDGFGLVSDNDGPAHMNLS